jgi:hypothetical protein
MRRLFSAIHICYEHAIKSAKAGLTTSISSDAKKGKIVGPLLILNYSKIAFFLRSLLYPCADRTVVC